MPIWGDFHFIVRVGQLGYRRRFNYLDWGKKRFMTIHCDDIERYFGWGIIQSVENIEFIIAD